MEVKIKETTLKLLIKNMFVEHPNVNQAVDMLFSSCPENVIASMLEILLTEEPYVPFEKGAWVLVNLEGYQRRDIPNQDVLQDMKLMNKDKFIGYIKDSSNYGDDFEPYNEKMEVDLFVCGPEGNVHQRVISVYSSELTLLHDKKAQSSLNDIKNNLLV